MIHRRLAAFLSLSVATPVAADLSLAQPIDCVLGESCYIQNYFDADPGDDSRDFTCNALSYNTHKGTDFAVPTVADAQIGVDILAAAPGTVLGTRDGMDDVWSGKIDRAALKGRDCGNGVVIDHGEGWHTQYCHLLSGSIAVAQGDQVQTGDVLGFMGMSGRTQFPHLHISVRRNGTPVDPFNPENAACTEQAPQQLWTTPIAYTPGGVLDIGFATKVPEYSDVKLGTADEKLTRISPAIVAYVYLFGGREGDQVKFTITGPGTFSVTDTYDVPRNRALFFRATGKKRRSAPWPGGVYQATAELVRDGRVIGDRTERVEIPR